MEDISQKPFSEKAKIKLADLAESTGQTLSDAAESVREFGTTVKESILGEKDYPSSDASEQDKDTMEKLAERGRKQAEEARVYGQVHGRTPGEKLDEARKALPSDDFNMKSGF